MTRIAYLDCFAGISGDMVLGALLDVGWELAALQGVVDGLGLAGVSVEASRVEKHHVAGTQVQIHAPANQALRDPAALSALIREGKLTPSTQQAAITVIMSLAQVEAQVHGIPLEAVHFHEVGAVDTLVDVVGAIAGLEALGVERIICSPLPWSRGLLKISHGVIPLPGPAVAALLEGAPIIGANVDGEMVTPTGAALAKGLAAAFGPMPSMTVSKVGYGAGQRDWSDRPNLLRVVIGETESTEATAQAENLIVLSCNIDDMNPQWYGPLIKAALSAGALDIWLTPAQMKKGRPAIIVQVLCRVLDAERLRKLLFEHTTTLGIREHQVTRWFLPRESIIVNTRYGAVRIKVADLGDGQTKCSPEHDDCATHAAEHGVSMREVWLAALQAADSVMAQSHNYSEQSSASQSYLTD